MHGPKSPEFSFNWLIVGAIKGFGQERNMNRGELLEVSPGGSTEVEGPGIVRSGERAPPGPCCCCVPCGEAAGALGFFSPLSPSMAEGTAP